MFLLSIFSWPCLRTMCPFYIFVWRLISCLWRLRAHMELIGWIFCYLERQIFSPIPICNNESSLVGIDNHSKSEPDLFAQKFNLSTLSHFLIFTIYALEKWCKSLNHFLVVVSACSGTLHAWNWIHLNFSSVVNLSVNKVVPMMYKLKLKNTRNRMGS